MPNNIIMADAQNGNPVYYTDNGTCYAENMELPAIRQGHDALYMDATNLKYVKCLQSGIIGGSNAKRVSNYFNRCYKLETAEFPLLQGIGTGFVEYFLGNCSALKTVVFGSVGHPISEMNNTSYTQKIFSGTTQNSLEITLYVDATTVAEIPTAVNQYAPWGATNATIIYRNSTTGEVITQ